MRSSIERVKPHLWIPVAIVVMVAVDQWTKMLAVQHLAGNHVFDIIPGFFDFSLVHNSGAAFGIGRSWNPMVRKIVFLGFSCFAVCLMFVFLVVERRQGLRLKVPLVMIIGGAVGNLIDRFRFGYVIDFIHVFYGNLHWPNFNVADSLICVGIGLFAIHIVRMDNEKASA